MNKRLLNYLSEICLLGRYQFGFRRNYSTNFALIDNKEVRIGVFLDLSKAFDTVDDSLLLLFKSWNFMYKRGCMKIV